MLLSTLLLTLFGQVFAAPASQDTFHESLTLHPLPDGRVSVLFEFTTYFSARRRSTSTAVSSSHHSLTPPSLLLPLQRNNVSELSVSFVAGQWDQRRSGEAGPLHYEAGGGGGEVRGTDDAWTAVTHALGGLFCAGLGPSDHGETVRTFGAVYPPQRPAQNLSHYLLPHPFLHLCTENLTPFLSLLPSKGLSGLSLLLAQPGIVFSWGFKTEGIDVVMPHDGLPGRWRGWWEGSVDLIPERGAGGSRAFSIETLFRKAVPRPFPEAETSTLRLILPDEEMGTEPPPDLKRRRWLDGKRREVLEWDLRDRSLIGKDIKFWWNGEGDFRYPRHLKPPPLSIFRTVTERHASDGTLSIRIANTADVPRAVVYSEIWPWWLKGWMSEMGLRLNGSEVSRHLMGDLSYVPSSPPFVSTSSLHVSLSVPAHAALTLEIPFTKLTLKYTEHRPDAERGVEIPSGILTLLDLESEETGSSSNDAEAPLGAVDPLRSGRRRIYTSRLLLDVPTPDFSMPYNVIMMSSTVLAVFFGLMQGALTRRWGWVEVPKASPDVREQKKGLSRKDGDAMKPDQITPIEQSKDGQSLETSQLHEGEAIGVVKEAEPPETCR